MYLAKASPGAGGPRGQPSAADPEGPVLVPPPRGHQPQGGDAPAPGRPNKKRKASLKPRQEAPVHLSLIHI
eukprot:1662617-Lingulodinium_polyedra.AAC.1